MSVNSLLSDSEDKGWCNLYVNTLTAYNGISGPLNGPTVFNDKVDFKDEVFMEKTLKMVNGHIVSADGQNKPWFVRQEDVKNGDGGSVPTGLLVSDTNQSGYKQFKTYESADGGYPYYGGVDDRVVVFKSAYEILDEGVEEEGLMSKSATHGVTTRGLEPQDFHTSNLLQNPGILQSVAVDDHHELRVTSILLADVDTAEAQNGDIIRYNSGTGQLQFESLPTAPSYRGHSLHYSRRPAIYMNTFRTDIYLGGLLSENLNYPEPFYGVVDDPTCRLSILKSADDQPADSSIFSANNAPPDPIYYKVENTVNPQASDRFLVQATVIADGSVAPVTFTVINTTQSKWWMSPKFTDNSQNTQQYSLQGVFGNGESFNFAAHLDYTPGDPNDGLRIFYVDTHITKIA